MIFSSGTFGHAHGEQSQEILKSLAKHVLPVAAERQVKLGTINDLAGQSCRRGIVHAGAANQQFG